jgi:nitrate reductase beta subunit
MDKIVWGPNWEELLGGEFEKRARDRNFQKIKRRCTASLKTPS